MPVTLIVEPDPNGHRFQAVANVAMLARHSGEDVVLATSAGAAASEEFRVYLADVPDLVVDARFDHVYPATRDMAATIAEYARRCDVSLAIVMDADQSLKRWWRVAPGEFRGLRRDGRMPRIHFMLTRYPAKLTLADRAGWTMRLAKGGLTLLAMTTRSLDHAAGFAGREDMTRGWVVKRARDPEICAAHSRDRAEIRARLGLPTDRRLIGIFGVLVRKNPPLVLDAMVHAGVDADLLLAGSADEEMHAWLAALPSELRNRVIVREGYLANDELDGLVAAVDVVALAMTLNGPSGIQGKALAADVPVVTAGSIVRERELIATDGGEAAELTVSSFGAALQRALAMDPQRIRRRAVPPATGEQFAAVLLGRRPDYARPRPPEGAAIGGATSS